MGKLFVISGSSGVGKGTIIKEFLLKHPEFELSISCTTRKPRDGEVDGVNYFFLTKEEFQKYIENDEFIEWAEFSGNMYGTKKSYVEKCLNENKNLILEIETQGAMNIKRIMKDKVKMIFILPPSFEELETRLRGRKTESEEAIQKRLEITKVEFELAESFDYKVVNDNVNNAVDSLEKIMCI